MKLTQKENAMIINALRSYLVGFIYQSKRLEIEKVIRKFKKELTSPYFFDEYFKE